MAKLTFFPAATASESPAVAGGQALGVKPSTGKYENAQTPEDVCDKRESAAADNTSGWPPTRYRSGSDVQSHFPSNPQTSPAPNAMKIKNNISIGM